METKQTAAELLTEYRAALAAGNTERAVVVARLRFALLTPGAARPAYHLNSRGYERNGRAQ